MSRPPKIKICNALCAKCIRHCKQDESALLVDCPRFQPYPFKIEKRKFEQLGLFDGEEDEKE